MYYSMQMYFANGGGPCYITSVGDYSTAITLGNATSGLQGGLTAIRKQDEPTLLLFPDANGLSSSDFNAINQSALTQCAELQDRFAIFDTYGDGETAIDNFRTGIGVDNLKYGAAYYPYLDTILDYQYSDTEVSVESSALDDSKATVTKIVSSLDLSPLSALASGLITTYGIIDGGVTPVSEDNLITVRSEVNSIVDYLVGLKEDYENMATIANDSGAAAEATVLNNFVTNTLDEAIEDLQSIVSTLNSTTSKTTVLNNLDQNSSNVFGILGGSILGDPTAGTGDFTLINSINTVNTTDVIALETAVLATSFVTTLDILETTDNALYNRIVAAISDFPVTLPPSSAMAGIYARVDNAVGVWKAPANVTVQYVQQPTVRISNEDQEDMNVTSSGKSVNAIRTFTGKGTLAWGARTLAGNDNEWRYISVRRFFNFVEESVSEATEQFVFEPNTANTWVRVRGLIESFLLQQWKAGALAGAKPEDAYYVRIGLGQTMTSQDVLEGRMIVEIGMAAVRPAEFIVLKFSHKMQEA